MGRKDLVRKKAHRFFRSFVHALFSWIIELFVPGIIFRLA